MVSTVDNTVSETQKSGKRTDLTSIAFSSHTHTNNNRVRGNFHMLTAQIVVVLSRVYTYLQAY